MVVGEKHISPVLSRFEGPRKSRREPSGTRGARWLKKVCDINCASIMKEYFQSVCRHGNEWESTREEHQRGLRRRQHIGKTQQDVKNFVRTIASTDCLMLFFKHFLMSSFTGANDVGD